MSPKYRLNKEDGLEIGKVLLWSGRSAISATAILVVEQVDFAEYTFVVPLINVLLYTAKRFVDSKE